MKRSFSESRLQGEWRIEFNRLRTNIVFPNNISILGIEGHYKSSPRTALITRLQWRHVLEGPACKYDFVVHFNGRGHDHIEWMSTREILSL